MNDADRDGKSVEIVIVRRRAGADHEDAHGGVWKVAFADFMTAMMAFFLVLWIVNSTSKETRVSVARYFNPVRLQEMTLAKKGLSDEESAGKESPTEKYEKAPPRLQDGIGAVTKAPILVESSGPPTSNSRAAGQPPAATHPSLRDPFARRSIQAIGADANQTSSKSVAPVEPAIRQGDAMRDASGLRGEVAVALGSEFAKLSGVIDVNAIDGGLAINITDGSDFAMFAVGSAVPEPRLKRILAAISTALRKREGVLVVRGHTDARPYRSDELANWQLSASRALAAHAALVDNGLAQARFDHIEGYADRRLKSPASPEARENRRIEIILKANPE